MIARRYFPALAMMLVCATPAAAQTIAAKGPEDQRLTRTDIARAGLFTGRTGVSASTMPYIEQDGSEAVRKGVVGNWQVADNVEVGVGMFSVSRYSRREPDFTRLRPMDDVGRRSQRIAAVGVSLRF